MLLLLLIAGLLVATRALFTPKGSPCAVACGTKAENFTGSDDLVCQDTAYTDNSKGVLLKQCILCLSDSRYIDNSGSYYGNSDQYWYLLHMKYVQQHCLVDSPSTAAAKNCSAQCKPMKTVLDVPWVNNKAGTQPQYGYCSWNSSQYMTYAEGCASCLHQQEGGVVLGNFADTTYSACDTKPLIQEDRLVTTARELFNSFTVSSSTPISSTIVSAAVTSTTIATTRESTNAAASAIEANVQSDSSTLSTGAATGIGVGATVLLFGSVAGSFFIVRRKKKAVSERRKFTKLYASEPELGRPVQVNELSGEGKSGYRLHEFENKSVPPQELDTSAR